MVEKLICETKEEFSVKVRRRYQIANRQVTTIGIDHNRECSDLEFH